MVKVAVTHHDEIDHAITEALDHLRVKSLIHGKLVAVKPNDTWASKTDTTGVTQPDTLRAVLRYLKQFEPRELIVSGGAGAAETDEVFRIAGLMEVVEQEGGDLFRSQSSTIYLRGLAIRAERRGERTSAVGHGQSSGSGV
jgi:uncharacterized protein (DUF362 family)